MSRLQVDHQSIIKPLYTARHAQNKSIVALKNTEQNARYLRAI